MKPEKFYQFSRLDSRTRLDVCILAWAIFFLLLLSGCGGSAEDSEESKKEIPHIDCIKEPKCVI